MLHKFAGELELALDGFQIVVLPLEQDEFFQAPLSEKIDLVRLLSKKYDAAAVIWLESREDTEIYLSLATPGVRRVAVKIARTKTGTGAGAELALAAAEMLGEAYLFTQEPLGNPVRQVVQARRDALPPLAQNEGKQEPNKSAKTRAWSMVTYFSTAGGVAGHKGESTRLGGGLGLEGRLVRGLFLRPWVLLDAGPSGRLPEGSTRGWGLEFGISLGYLFELGIFHLGPTIGIEGSRRTFMVDTSGTETQYFENWSMGGGIGASLRLQLGRMLSFVVDPRVGVESNNQELSYVSDNQPVVRSPRFDWWITVGLSVNLAK